MNKFKVAIIYFDLFPDLFFSFLLLFYIFSHKYKNLHKITITHTCFYETRGHFSFDEYRNKTKRYIIIPFSYKNHEFIFIAIFLLLSLSLFPIFIKLYFFTLVETHAPTINSFIFYNLHTTYFVN